MTGTQWLTIASKRRQDDGVSPAGCKQKRDERIPLVACKKDGGTIINPLARRSPMPYSHDPIAFTHLQMSISFKEARVVEDPKSFTLFPTWLQRILEKSQKPEFKGS
jgi:hypothetical protein